MTGMAEDRNNCRYAEDKTNNRGKLSSVIRASHPLSQYGLKGNIISLYISLRYPISPRPEYIVIEDGPS